MQFCLLLLCGAFSNLIASQLASYAELDLAVL